MKITTEVTVRSVEMRKRFELDWAYITLQQSDHAPFAMLVGDADARALAAHIGKEVTITIETKE